LGVLREAAVAAEVVEVERFFGGGGAVGERPADEHPPEGHGVGVSVVGLGLRRGVAAGGFLCVLGALGVYACPR
jgi:hypothetical protein